MSVIIKLRENAILQFILEFIVVLNPLNASSVITSSVIKVILNCTRANPPGFIEAKVQYV